MNQDTKERVLSTVNVHVGLAPIPHLDLTSEAEKLQIKEKATEEGCKNIPLSDSTNPLNDYEATITHHVSEYCLSLQSIFENRIHHLKTSIDEDDTDIVACEKSVRLIPEEFVQNARHLLSDRAPEMQRVTERRSSRRQEYKEFCQENRLKRVAKVPETINSILQILSLIVIVIVDTFANSTFFASGLENGLIGGIIIAFLAATSNAFYCFFLGLASKNIFHVNPTKRVLGWLALISAILGSACIAVSVGHYRDALQISPDNAAVLALQNLSNSPLDLVDIQSYFLAFLTLAFGTTSLIDGIFWKDLYPGFTEITNQKEQAEEEYGAVLSELRQELGDMKESALNEVDEKITRAANALNSMKSSLLDENQEVNRWYAEMKQVDSIHRALITQFRTINQEVRDTPPPIYYQEPIESITDKYTTIPDRLTVDKHLKFKGETLVEALKRDQNSIKHRIMNVYTDRIMELQ